MIKAVAKSYAELPNLGFKAFDKSSTYKDVQKILSMAAATKAPEVDRYLYVFLRPGRMGCAGLLESEDSKLAAKACATLQSWGKNWF